MTDVEIIGLLKTYVNKTLVGGGALKGKNCTIDSIVPISGGGRVTFKWTLDDGTVETGHLDVMNGLNGQDGEDGKDGKGIQSVSVNENNHLIITYSDGTTTDAGQIEIHSAVDSVNGQTGAVVLDAEAVGALPANTPIPSKTSDLTNDSGFITKVVNDLVSYYLKSETYSKTEVDDIVTAIKNSRFEVVATLPTTDIKTNVIYLVPKSPSQTSNVKDEYINLDGTTSGWEKIGDTEIDLSDYVTTQALNTALADYTTTDDLTTLLAAKQDTLTFDDAPTENSNNPVKSGGVFTSEQDIFEVMGQNGAKNLIPYPYAETTKTQNGVTFTDNGDGTITVNGTASANTLFTISTVLADVLLNDNTTEYILSGCEGGGGATYKLVVDDTSDYSIICNQFDNEADFTIASSHHGIRASIVVYSGQVMSNVIFKPMVRLASDTDSTYQPYSKTNQKLTAETQALANQVKDMVNVLGAKNVLPFPYYEGSGTYNGVTITDNGDGSITLDGTCTGMSFFVFYGGRYSLAPTTFVKKNEDYIATLEVVSGSMAINSGTSRFVFRNYITNATSPFVDIFYEDNVIGTRSVKFTYEPTASYDTSLVWYEFNVGTTFNNWRIRPMIRLASIEDDTYEPYAKTNQQLTVENQTLTNYDANTGVKNLFDNTATNETSDGVTFTVSTDKRVSVVGTLTTDYVVKVLGTFHGEAGKQYLVTGGISSTKFVEVYNTSAGIDVKDTGNGVTFIPQSDTDFDFVIVISGNGSTFNDTFSPMIRSASITDPTYQPYAKTNRELTTSATTNAKNISTINKGTLDIDAIELTANTPKKVISSYGVYLITFNHGGGAPGGLYLVQVHATDVNGMQVAVIKESTDRTVSFDLTVVNQLTVTASGNGRMRIIKLDASNY